MGSGGPGAFMGSHPSNRRRSSQQGGGHLPGAVESSEAPLGTDASPLGSGRSLARPPLVPKLGLPSRLSDTGSIVSPLNTATIALG